MFSIMRRFTSEVEEYGIDEAFADVTGLRRPMHMSYFKMAQKMKEEIQKRQLVGKIRINKSGCLGQCSKGISIVVYPEGVWYGHVTKEDVAEIVEKHLVGNEPVERLRTNLNR